MGTLIGGPTTVGTAVVEQARRVFRGGIARWQNSPFANMELLRERWAEAWGGHRDGVDGTGPTREALAWLERAQDAGAGGIARGFSLASIPHLGGRGWQAPYPETTGYIIPTLYAAAWLEERPWLTMRATRAARWELEVQQPSGAIPAGMVGQGSAPAVFNTGQVIFGWLCASIEVGDQVFETAAARAARWLVQCIDQDGVWRRGQSPFARGGASLYNARTAWALLAAGHQLGEAEFTAAGASALRNVARAAHPNGWLPECCLTDPARPLTHTLAYAIQGLLEGGVLLQDDHLITLATKSAGALADALHPDGFLAGRFDAKWHPAVSWSCLTGTAQMANVWLRLAELLDAPHWRGPADRALRFLASTQNRTSLDPGLRGGIKGSHPCTGEYGRFQTLSWATKFFVDAKLRLRASPTDHLGMRARACLALA